MNDPMQVARTKCEALRRETRELEEFIRFGDALLKGDNPSSREGREDPSSRKSESDTPSHDHAVGEN